MAAWQSLCRDCQEGQPLHSAPWQQGEKQLTWFKAESFRQVTSENVFTTGADHHWNRFPERFYHLHPWRFPVSNMIKSWATWCDHILISLWEIGLDWRLPVVTSNLIILQFSDLVASTVWRHSIFFCERSVCCKPHFFSGEVKSQF